MLKMTFPKIGLESSALGFGCMRFPTDADGNIIEDEAIRMVRHAIDNGVNYIDTAYPYHNGKSELLVGKALKDGYREKVILATKLPVWDVETHEDMMKLLDEQLEKLHVDCIDFYLMHALNAERLEKIQKLNYKQFLADAMAQGKIKYPAFSFHDDYDAFIRILNDYDWKMCQVQMNILDDHNQATLKGIEAAHEKGVGVVVMEPLRGGLLANPPSAVVDLYRQWPTQRSAVDWAFRYLYTMPGVVTILSGMSTMEQLDDNLRIFDVPQGETRTAEDDQLYEQVKAAYMACTKTRCTGCKYCQPCPRGVKIPNIFQGYDTSLMRGNGSFKQGYAKIAAEEGDASRCVECGQCEAACPQHLPIIQYLQEIHTECAE